MKSALRLVLVLAIVSLVTIPHAALGKTPLPEQIGDAFHGQEGDFKPTISISRAQEPRPEENRTPDDATPVPEIHHQPRIGDVYNWTEGYTERKAQLVRFEHKGNEKVPIFYDPVTRIEMTLPGGVILITEQSVTKDQLQSILRQVPLGADLEPIEDAPGTYMVHSPPGAPALHLAQRLADMPAIDTAIPEWHGHFYVAAQDPERDPEREEPTEATTEDIHGDTNDAATPVVIEEQLYRGTLTPDDVDYFSITIPEGETSIYAVRISTSIARYARYNYFRMALEDAGQECLARPCHQEEGLSRTYLLEPGTYYLRTFPSYRMTTGEMSYSFRVTREEDRYQEKLRCAAIETKYDDTYYGCQWHHNNNTQNGFTRTAPTVGGDLNTEAAWDAGIMGQGVHVRIADKGMDIHHADIRDNVDVSLNNDYRSRTWGHYRSNRGNVNFLHSNHGDMMAGLIAARDNDIGYRGVAPRATISMHNSVTKRTLGEAISALRKETAQIGVSSNSFSVTGAPRPTMVTKEWEQVIERALTTGDHGRGIAIFYSGNTIKSYLPGSDTNTSAFQTHPGTMPVCAISDNGKRTVSSGKGYSFWICAPGGSHAPTKLDSYVMFSTGSTSGATAVAAGTAALIRSANRDLTWRDVKLILAQSAQKAEPEHPEWLTAGAHYLNPSQRYHYNPWYGFGVADAGEAVRLAQSWTNLPEATTDTVTHQDAFTVPDLTAGGTPNTIETTFRYEGDINFVEYVNIMVEFDHPSTRDLRITLESPTGATSEILAPYVSEYPTDIRGTHRFASTRHLGENPNGKWKVRFADEVQGKSGSIQSIELVIMGHQSPAPANTPATGQPSVVSGLMVGDTISVDTSEIADPDGIDTESYSYRWIVYDGETPESSSQSDSDDYQVLAQHLGKRLKIEVHFQDHLGNAEMAASEPTEPVKAHKPTAPTSVSAQALTETSASVSWSTEENSGGLPVLSYTVQWRTDQETWEQAQSTTTADGQTRSANIENLATGVQYHFRVWATTVVGHGTPSQATTTTLTDVTPPLVQNITAESNVITIAYNETLSEALPPNPRHFTVTTDDDSINVSETAIYSSTVTLVLETYLTEEDVVTLQYQGADSQNNRHALTKDAAGNRAADISGATVSNITPEPSIDTTITITRIPGYSPELSGYNFYSEGMGQIAEDTFKIGEDELSIIYVLQLPGQASIGVSSPITQDFVVHIGEKTFRGSSALYTPLIASYSWPIEESLWPDQQQIRLSITPFSSEPKPMPELKPRPPYLHVYKNPLEHDGKTLTFHLMFSEHTSTTADELKENILQLTNAEITRVVAANSRGQRWYIHANPRSTKEVNISVPAYEDCGSRPNLCTEDGTPTGNGIQATIPGPPMTAQFVDVPQSHDGQNDFTVSVLFSESLGTNGQPPKTQSLRVAFATIKQVTANDNNDRRWDITLTPSGDNPVTMVVLTIANCEDERAVCTETGKPLSHTGHATLAAEPASQERPDQEDAPTEPPPAPTNLTATENADLSITLNWTAPDDASVTGYQILRRRPQMDEQTLLVLVEDTGTAETSYTDQTSTDQTRYVYRVKAINSAGIGQQSNYVRIDR